MFKNKYEADNSRFGEVLTQVLLAHSIGIREFLAETKVSKTRFYDIKRGKGDNYNINHIEDAFVPPATYR